ncbi:hypothetical protein GCM10025857_20370 [Alicyclobacillus contaminans]|uniref:ABC transporter permease n=1 Tax=Alicyclobacillus contaminans TaxID=392016 RepID=UPI00041DC763|nr:ABC transporter permease [Alicyclobacillus contaminans]GMA50680.1 hypothetical protein GCM10025857_20370 [Alicyclobacillus contaminans]
MFKLLSNENMKIYRRLRTWILLGIILLATVLVAVVIRTHEQENPNWKQTLIAQNADLQQSLQHDQQLPPESRQHMQSTIQMNQYYIDHNLNPTRMTGWKFATTAESLSALLIAFIVVVAGDIVASEFSTGTIKMLLTQTATRTQILLSKYVAALLHALFMTAAMLVFSLLCGWIVFGMAGAGEPQFFTDGQGHMHQMPVAGYLFMHYGFLFIEVIFTATIAFMVSAIFRSSTLAITLSVLAFFVGNTLVAALSRYSWVKYILFANTDLSRYVEGGPPVAGMTLGFSIIMLIIYFVVMNLLAWYIFTKRDVALT